MEKGKYRQSLVFLSVCVTLTTLFLEGARAQSQAFCFDVLKQTLPMCTPRDEEYSDGAYSAWFNNLPNVPSDQRCVYAANDGVVTFDPPKLKPGRAVKISWTPQPYLSTLSQPGWVDFQVPRNIALVSYRLPPAGCAAPPSYALIRQPTSDADCTGNVCNYLFELPRRVFAPGHFAAVIDYKGFFIDPTFPNGLAFSGRMNVPVEVIENQLPVAKITATRISGLRFLISGLSSTDDEQLAEFQWRSPSLQDGDPRVKKPEFEYDFPTPGLYAFGLTVKDRDDEFSVVNEVLRITEDSGVAPTPTPASTPTPPSQTSGDSSVSSALGDRVQSLRDKLRQLRLTYKKADQAKQAELRRAIRSETADLREFVEANNASINVNDPKNDAKKLVRNAQKAISTLLRLRRTFTADRVKANKALDSFLRALAR